MVDATDGAAAAAVEPKETAVAPAENEAADTKAADADAASRGPEVEEKVEKEKQNG